MKLEFSAAQTPLEKGFTVIEASAGYGEDNDDIGHRFAIAGRAGDPDRANSGYDLYGACDRGIAWSHSRHNPGRAYPAASAIRPGDHQESYRPKTIRAQVKTGAAKF